MWNSKLIETIIERTSSKMNNYNHLQVICQDVGGNSFPAKKDLKRVNALLG